MTTDNKIILDKTIDIDNDEPTPFGTRYGGVETQCIASLHQNVMSEYITFLKFKAE